MYSGTFNQIVVDNNSVPTNVRFRITYYKCVDDLYEKHTNITKLYRLNNGANKLRLKKPITFDRIDYIAVDLYDNIYVSGHWYLFNTYMIKWDNTDTALHVTITTGVKRPIVRINDEPACRHVNTLGCTLF